MIEEVYFRIRNFEEFQHYSKRNPPWIRLYYRILHDRKFYRLNADIKYVIIGLFLIASQNENKIPADVDWLETELHLPKTKTNWQIVVDSGFIIPINCDASELLSRLTKTCSHSITDNSEGITEILSISDKMEEVVGQKRSLQECSLIFKSWNEQPATMHHRAIKSHEKAIKQTLSRYSSDEIIAAIERYNIVRQNTGGKYRDLYQWTLSEFLTRQNHYNLERFNAENWEQPFVSSDRTNVLPNRTDPCRQDRDLEIAEHEEARSFADFIAGLPEDQQPKSDLEMISLRAKFKEMHK